MAQVEFRFFDGALPIYKKQAICENAEGFVFRVHYPNEVDSRRILHGLRLRPGDVTCAVSVLDTSLSKSDAQYELEISEGSDNWPRNEEGLILPHDEAKIVLDKRAEQISILLRKIFPDVSHNIFEVTGQATGWVQYKPEPELS